jgi:hypothetical protein
MCRCINASSTVISIHLFALQLDGKAGVKRFKHMEHYDCHFHNTKPRIGWYLSVFMGILHYFIPTNYEIDNYPVFHVSLQ